MCIIDCVYVFTQEWFTWWSNISLFLREKHTAAQHEPLRWGHVQLVFVLRDGKQISPGVFVPSNKPLEDNNMSFKSLWLFTIFWQSIIQIRKIIHRSRMKITAACSPNICTPTFSKSHISSTTGLSEGRFTSHNSPWAAEIQHVQTH